MRQAVAAHMCAEDCRCPYAELDRLRLSRCPAPERDVERQTIEQIVQWLRDHFREGGNSIGRLGFMAAAEAIEAEFSPVSNTTKGGPVDDERPT